MVVSKRGIWRILKKSKNRKPTQKFFHKNFLKFPERNFFSNSPKKIFPKSFLINIQKTPYIITPEDIENFSNMFQTSFGRYPKWEPSNFPEMGANHPLSKFFQNIFRNNFPKTSDVTNPQKIFPKIFRKNFSG